MPALQLTRPKAHPGSPAQPPRSPVPPLNARGFKKLFSYSFNFPPISPVTEGLLCLGEDQCPPGSLLRKILVAWATGVHRRVPFQREASGQKNISTEKCRSAYTPHGTRRLGAEPFACPHTLSCYHAAFLFQVFHAVGAQETLTAEHT